MALLLLGSFSGNQMVHLGGAERDAGRAAVFSGSNFLVAGYTSSKGNGGEDVWLVALQRDGRILWENTFGGPGDERANAILPLPDGCVLAGYTTSWGSGWRDFLLLRVDSSGRELWRRTFGGPRSDRAFCLAPLGKGFLVGGQTDSEGAGGFDGMVAATDEEGNELWRRTYGGPGNDGIYCICKVGSDFLLGGTKEGDAWLLKIDSSGDIIWERTYGTAEENEVVYSIERAGDEFLLGGSTTSKGGDMLVCRVDSSGNLRWSKTFGGQHRESCYSLARCGDTFIAVGNTGSFGEGLYDAYVVALDEDGNQRWARTVGGAGDEEAYSVLLVDDSLAIFGYTTSFENGEDLMYVLVKPPSPAGGMFVYILAGLILVLGVLFLRGLIRWKKAKELF